MSTWQKTGIVSIQTLARIGYLAKGLVFIALGMLSLLAVFGFAEGRVTGTDGAIFILGRQAPGRIGFGLLVAGLGAHVFWRLYQALVDPDGRGRSVPGLVLRAGFLISAGFYLSLVLVALSAITGLAGGSRLQEVGQALLTAPGGRLGLGAIGAGVIAVGGYQLIRAWRQPYRQRWMTRAGLARFHAPMAWLCSYGIAARALLFFILGWHLLRAGWFATSDEIIDMAAALWRIGTETWGELLLGMMASGLLFYGVYCLFNAAFRRIDPLPDDRGEH